MPNADDRFELRKLYTTPEVAELHGTSRHAVAAACREGRLKYARRVGRLYLISGANARDWSPRNYPR